MRDAADKQAASEEAPTAGCARIFRDVADLKNSKAYFGWSEEQVLQAPLETFDVDSLTLLEFVMAVEEAYQVELNEDAVNSCENVGDLARLVAAARNA